MVFCFRVVLVMTASIRLHDLSQHQHLRKWGELMGRTEEIIQLLKPEKPCNIKGFRLESYQIATMISSRSR